MTPAEDLRQARQAVLERVAAACARVGRDPATITLLPVSKGITADRLALAIESGMVTFGENRVQEAEGKAADLPSARWELVGRLQSNKARRAAALFGVIHSVDSVELGRRLAGAVADEGRAALPVYLQVNVYGDAAKGGFSPLEIERSLDHLLELATLELRGLMTVGRPAGQPEEARPTFVRLCRLSDDLRRRWPSLGAGLSMGMSDDFEVAVEEGATVVRVGRALFGARPSG